MLSVLSKLPGCFHHSLQVQVILVPEAVQQLRMFPFLNGDACIANLQGKLPAYLAAADGVHANVDTLSWWEERRVVLSHLSQAFTKLLLVQPSSAAAERVFSILRASFDSQQESSLKDYLEASVMMQYIYRLLDLSQRSKQDA